jgi:hypothetical protein
VPNLDFGPVELPDLDDTDKYPTVAHSASCVDAQPFETKSCHATPLFKVRPYAFVTEPLGKLKQPRPLHPQLPPFPPSLGTHCPTIQQDIEIETGDAGSVEHSVTHRNGDACRPTLIQKLKFPCTIISASVNSATGYPSGITVDPPTSNRDNNQCGAGLTINATLPTDGGTGFTVGTDTVGGTTSPMASACCATAYAPGAEVPVVDNAGILGDVGEQLDASQNEIVNADREPMIQGDTVTLERAAVQAGGRVRWKAYLA